jgi:hypothetical protein
MQSLATRSAAELDELVRQLDLVDPTDPNTARSANAFGLQALAGARVGLLDNRKPNAALLLSEVGDLLRTRYQLAAAEPRTKFIYSRPAAADLVAELSAFDAVITAIGD